MDSMDKSKKTAKRRKPNTSNPDQQQYSSTFPFLKLPAEIRNMIYKLVLATDDEIEFQRAYENREKGRFLIKRQRPHIITNNDINVKLLRVSKQIREEATVFLYSGNTFFFFSANTLPKFFSQYATHVRDIRSITLNVCHCSQAALEKAFSYLAFADRLERLCLHYQMSPRYTFQDNVDIFFWGSRYWLEAVGIRKGNKNAALQMITWPFELRTWAREHDGSKEEEHHRFQMAIKDLLR
ncbi:hypothetical protein P280DRAFT_137576 [Massarina eburnea CBS 473.64]|uniref:DUF7730 domain-containing protein n=1 Tax=Massarina eburnea CBS 473.64 TaxID=1395130 RepID=A0A6A6RR15_9PLEO|nr:hypothetical protein P280DRAFT_137576 [Massarina eburnea CBS 473.64]